MIFEDLESLSGSGWMFGSSRASQSSILILELYCSYHKNASAGCAWVDRQEVTVPIGKFQADRKGGGGGQPPGLTVSICENFRFFPMK